MYKLLSEDFAMTLMRVRRAAQLTLPADIRQALNVKEGDCPASAPIRQIGRVEEGRISGSS